MKVNDIAILILRIPASMMMLLHGISKVSKGVKGIENSLIDAGWPGFIAYGVYLGEIVAPILIIIGFRTRIAAAVFAFNMIVAVSLAHPDDVMSLAHSGAWAIELQALYFFTALSLVFSGGGRYAVSRNKFGD